MAGKETTYDKIERALFKSESEASLILSKAELEIKNRIMLCVSKKMEDPLFEESKLVSFLTGGCGGTCTPVSQSQAYRDLAMVSRLVGNITLSSKAWYRYMIVESCKKGIKLAEEERDAKGMAANADKIGKYTRSDKEDDAFDWSTMVPPSWEPSDDVTLLEGIQPIANLEEERTKFRSLFINQMQKQAVTVTVEKEEEEE